MIENTVNYVLSFKPKPSMLHQHFTASSSSIECTLGTENTLREVKIYTKDKCLPANRLWMLYRVARALAAKRMPNGAVLKTAYGWHWRPAFHMHACSSYETVFRMCISSRLFFRATYLYFWTSTLCGCTEKRKQIPKIHRWTTLDMEKSGRKRTRLRRTGP